MDPVSGEVFSQKGMLEKSFQDGIKLMMYMMCPPYKLIPNLRDIFRHLF
jgi:hypothetical protein